MENDDLPVGQILSRRDALKLLGIGSAAFLAHAPPRMGQALSFQQQRPRRFPPLPAPPWTVSSARK